MTFFLGLDLGQTADPTAIAVLERQHAPAPENVTGAALRPVTTTHVLVNAREVAASYLFHCRHVERLALGTPYPAIAEHVGQLLATPALRGRTTLVVDGTGVGKPVVDWFIRAGLAPVSITITGGDAVVYDGAGYKVPKRDLVAAVSVLLQTGRLKLAADLPAVPALVQELLAFRARIDPVTAHDSYAAGGWRDGGVNDDMVLALAVAAWYGQRPEVPRRQLPGSRSWGPSVARGRFGG